VKLFIGQTRLGGSLHRYAARFDMVELRAEPARLPRLVRLREWRDSARPGFVFALVIGQGAYGDAGSEDALEYVKRAADALEPAWWVLRTPTSLTPAASSVRRLAALKEALPRGPRVAWEPSGPWDERGTVRTAKELGVHLVRDGSRESLPAEEVIYTRLRALGEGANVGASAAEHLAVELAGREEAYVVVEGAGAGRVRAVLRGELLDEDEP
jgi:uncharacterized protein YecE (DUF72 family)